jgi:biopolymer transport protein ExbB
MGEAPALGFGHFIAQSDIVAKVLLAVLAIMSAISWYLIVYKGVSQVVRQKRSAKFLSFFWSATSLEAVQNELSVHGVHEPFGHLAAHAMHAQAHHAKFGAAKLEEAGSEQEFLTRTIKKVLDEETTALENGLTMLATIGATAPFVGLFGTVWGIMNSFIGISEAHTTNLAVVAPGIAEALLATALGLVAAIPAVVIYNHLARSIAAYRALLTDASAQVLLLVSRQRDTSAFTLSRAAE